MTVTRRRIADLLEAHQRGDADAFQRLIPLVYPDLRRIAHARLRRAHPGGSLNTTSLVHEAYIKLVDRQDLRCEGRGHFYALAARAMRQIIVDYLRARSAQKRGGGAPVLRLEEDQIAAEQPADALLAIDQALTRLDALDEGLSHVVECRFFAGLTEEETAAALGMSLRTVQRQWLRARAWLRQELSDPGPAG